MEKNKLFDLEFQYQLYLLRVGLKPETMHSVQAIETKRAFFGAWGQLLILMRDNMPGNEDMCVQLLQDMHDQVALFWMAQKGQRN